MSTEPPAPRRVPTPAGLEDLPRLVATGQPADVADLLSALDPAEAAAAIVGIPREFAARVLEQPEFPRRAALMEHLPSDVAVGLITAMSPDQQADLIRELSDRARRRILPGLDPSTRQTIENLLSYPPTAAGGIMTTDYFSVPPGWTAQEALQEIRRSGRRRPVYAVYVVEPQTRVLVHVTSLRELVLADPRTPMTEVGERRRVVTVGLTMDREEVARLISKYNLLAVPVVDERGRLRGTITVDDVIDAILSEQTEDVHKLGGMEALDEPYPRIHFVTMLRKRAGWLSALFLGEMLTASAMQHFEVELSKAIVLSLFIPLIISSGGNSGSQATSLIIRALALGELRLRDWWRVAMRELPAGFALGGVLGVIGVARITLWQMLGVYDYGAHWILVAATVGLALVGVVAFGSVAGAMLPFVLQSLGFDPASASAPFVATLVDVTGLSIYFTVAYLVLSGTML
jgi:magnesium transporter